MKLLVSVPELHALVRGPEATPFVHVTRQMDERPLVVTPTTGLAGVQRPDHLERDRDQAPAHMAMRTGKRA